MDRAQLDRRLRPRPVVVFCAVTLLIWTNRIPLAWTNDEDTVAEKLVWSVPITLFVIAALVVVVSLLRGVTIGTPWLLRTARAFAAGTIVYWGVRAPMIIAGDWSLGFKVVHAVLASASVAAAAAAFLSTRAGELAGGSRAAAGPQAAPATTRR